MPAVSRLPSTRLFLHWLFVIAWGALIWTVSSLPLHGPVFESAAKKHLDWAAHAVEYGVFGALLGAAFAETLGTRRLRAAAYATVFAGAAFGIADEIHQAFIPFRESSAADAWADFAGLAAGVSVRIKRIRRSSIHARN